MDFFKSILNHYVHPFIFVSAELKSGTHSGEPWVTD